MVDANLWDTCDERCKLHSAKCAILFSKEPLNLFFLREVPKDEHRHSHSIKLKDESSISHTWKNKQEWWGVRKARTSHLLPITKGEVEKLIGEVGLA